MSTIIYSTTPPTPDALTDAEADLLRADLSEPALQSLGNALTRVGNPPTLIDLDPGVTLVSNPLTHGGWTKILIPPEVWIDSTGAQELTVGTIPAKCRVAGCYLDVTTKYAGLAGTIEVEVGHDTDPNYFIVSADVKTAAVTLGIADADLGVGLVNASAVQGVAIPSWSVTKDLTITLTSGTGDLGDDEVTNLTTGTAYLLIKLEQLP